MFKVTLSLL